MEKRKTLNTDGEEEVLEGEVYVDENGEVVFKILGDPKKPTAKE